MANEEVWRPHRESARGKREVEYDVCSRCTQVIKYSSLMKLEFVVSLSTLDVVY